VAILPKDNDGRGHFTERQRWFGARRHSFNIDYIADPALSQTGQFQSPGFSGHISQAVRSRIAVQIGIGQFSDTAGVQYQYAGSHNMV
jgi:hypothetical protein